MADDLLEAQSGLAEAVDQEQWREILRARVVTSEDLLSAGRFDQVVGGCEHRHSPGARGDGARHYRGSRCRRQNAAAGRDGERSMHSSAVSRRVLALLAVLAGLTGVALWKTSAPVSKLVVVSIAPEGIMGTDCRISVVVPPAGQEAGRESLAAAEAELRRVEALMSTWIDDSEISRLNRLAAGKRLEVSPATAEVLAAAHRLNLETGGGFDVTCRPLIELWRRAGRDDRMPPSEAIERALMLVGWKGLRLDGRWVEKVRQGARVDLGG
ncbi:MAG TPA: hypothetical protein ENK10_07315, partial [Acidobacteria bacterium]|nr:hypothetical protein [Acidobacteriota bacterium]